VPRTGETVWRLERIRKAYPGVVANDDVSLELKAGEIQGLLGENGCGKSTLIKTLSGAHRPDSGTIYRRGEPVTLSSPVRARELGVATVFQEFSVVPTLTVAENIHLGRWPGGAARVGWRAMREQARRALDQMEVAIDPDAALGDLPVARQQLVEIAKAIAADASMIILDEPTTALGVPEIAQLHALLRRLRAQGCSILYVSHRLDEVTALVDVATVMRNGRVVSTAEETRIDIPSIVAAMVGAEVAEHYPKERNATAEPLLEADRLTTDRVRDVSFALRRGEVLGLGGVLGSGRTEIARALFGLDPLRGGRMRLEGREVRFGGPKDAIAAGLALLTENRKSDGLFFNFDGARNLTIANLDALTRGMGRLDLAEERRVAGRFIDRLQISRHAAVQNVDRLSGGNQQKVIVGRWLHTGAKVFILDEPTQGIDIGAKVAVYRLINEITRAGNGVILISADDEELLAMADRVALVRHGTVTSVRDARELAKEELVRSGGGTGAELAA
jgi:ribose transport system ATP-binding protein